MCHARLTVSVPDPTRRVEDLLREGTRLMLSLSAFHLLSESSKLAEGNEELANDWYSREGWEDGFLSLVMTTNSAAIAGCARDSRVRAQIRAQSRCALCCVPGATRPRRLSQGVLVTELPHCDVTMILQEIAALFPSQLDQLRAKHTQLLARLEDRMCSWKWQGVYLADRACHDTALRTSW